METDNKLNEWAEALQVGLERMNGLTDGLTHEAFNFKPAPGKWSVGECIRHLVASMELYLDVMEPAVESAPERAGNNPLGRGTVLGRVLLKALRKPGKRYKAPGKFKPASSDLDPSETRAGFERAAGRLRELTERCEGLAIGNIKVSSPAFPLVKMSIAQTIEMLVIHNDRHLAQAERVTSHADFPGASAVR